MPKAKITLPKMPPARHVRRDGYKLAYVVVGPDGGKPLVLCHGLAATGLQFIEDAAFFADKGFRVIVPDLRGHGRSERGPKKRALFSIAHLADDLLAILDKEKVTQADWVGNSLGGILGLEILGRAPRRIDHFAAFGTSYSLNVPGFVVPLGVALTRLSGKTLLSRFLAPMTCSDPHASTSNLRVSIFTNSHPLPALQN
jgi:3-oxoadipate enol-lactonase